MASLTCTSEYNLALEAQPVGTTEHFACDPPAVYAHTVLMPTGSAATSGQQTDSVRASPGVCKSVRTGLSGVIGACDRPSSSPQAASAAYPAAPPAHPDPGKGASRAASRAGAVAPETDMPACSAPVPRSSPLSAAYRLASARFCGAAARAPRAQPAPGSFSLQAGQRAAAPCEPAAALRSPPWPPRCRGGALQGMSAAVTSPHPALRATASPGAAPEARRCWPGCAMHGAWPAAQRAAASA